MTYFRLSPYLFVVTLGLAACGSTPEPVEVQLEPALEQTLPEGSLRLIGLTPGQFSSLAVDVNYIIDDTTFNQEFNDTEIVLNGQPIDASSFQVNASNISTKLVLSDGKNELSLKSYDVAGRPLYDRRTIWAGANTLNVQIVDEQGQPYTKSAAVKLSLSDDPTVGLSSTTSSGAAQFEGVPTRTIVVNVQGQDQDIGVGGDVGNSGTILVRMLKTDTPSDVSNNDFSQGLSGWNVDVGTATIIEHQEQAGPALSGQALFKAAGPRDGGALIQGQATPVNPDLLLSTVGQGPSGVSRAFAVTPGTSSVEMRYRFITSEVPGGYFGSQYNDYYSVALRSAKSGAITDGNTMNGLGLAAFDPSGSIAWRTVTLPTDPTGDSIQVNAVVANVADAKLDSQVIIDYVKENKDQVSSKLSWDNVAGGLKLEIKVEGNKLEADAKIEVYFASGESVGSKLGGVLYTQTLPAGTVPGTKTFAIAGNLLTAAPIGTTNLISVVNGSEVFALPDVEIIGGPNANMAMVGEKMTAAVKASLRAAGQARATITSTVRTPADQARAMFDNLVNSANSVQNNVNAQLALYAAAGDAVIETFVSQAGNKSRSEIVADRVSIKAAMEATINAQGPGNVSKHCGDPAIRSVVDVGAAAFVSNINLFVSEATKQVDKLIDERSTNKAIHLEVAN